MSQPPAPPLPPPPLTPPPPEPTLLKKIFVGRSGIRAGWRLLIFFAMLFVIGGGLNLLVRLVLRGRPRPSPTHLDAVPLVIGEAVQFSLLLFITFLMSRLEKRRIREYGLALGRGFRLTFWEGVFYGFGGLTLVLVVMRLSGHYDFGPLALHGGGIFYFGLLYLVGFLGTGFFEEYSFRGYVLYTLTDGLSGLGPIRPATGFWISAILLSSLFGFAHSRNPGETPLGLISVVVFALVFCFVLWRTGDLWMAVGFHMAWDWGQTYFYGVPDSGLISQAHLLSPSFHGPDWWTGGSTGPEASFLTPLVLLLIALAVHLRYRSVKYRPGADKAN
jgi:membrane protease YdiL (CAAX protease family)